MKKKVWPILMVLSIVLVLVSLLWRSTAKLAEENIGLNVVFIDVGKADSILVQTADFNMLVDTGTSEDAQAIRRILNQNNVEKLDYLVLTHLDKDHIGSTPYILENYEVKHIIQPEYEKDSEEHTAYLEALTKAGIEPVYLKQEGDIELGDGNRIHFYPPKKDSYEQSNDYSLVTSITYGDHSFLLTGDAEKERMEEIVEQISGAYTVVKIPHHGDYKKMLEEVLEKTSPEYCIVSTSEDNLEEKLTECLDNLAIPSYYTFNGTVIMRTDGKELTIIQ